MRDRIAEAERFGLILGASYLLGALALLTVMLTVDMTSEVFLLLGSLCVALGLFGPFLLWLAGKEAFMKIGVVERIREKRRMAMAVDLAERYQGIDLTNDSGGRGAAHPIVWLPRLFQVRDVHG